jgi:hypothetical protein
MDTTINHPIWKPGNLIYLRSLVGLPQDTGPLTYSILILQATKAKPTAFAIEQGLANSNRINATVLLWNGSIRYWDINLEIHEKMALAEWRLMDLD